MVQTGAYNQPEASVAERVRDYIDAFLVDESGILYSGIDSHTNCPFPPDFVTPIKVPRRAHVNPWAYWTYEDSVLSMGLYMDGLMQQYTVTKDNACLQRCAFLWQAIKLIYASSQVHGIGSFLRPYGGLQEMHRFLEPLGTDQASPLHSGLLRYLPHAPAKTQAEITRILLQTLDWYGAQDFEYLYYKYLIHSYDLNDSLSVHANSYYLPAILWAQAHGKPQAYQRVLEQHLTAFQTGHYNPAQALIWGSEFEMVQTLLDDRFDLFFPEEVLENAWTHCMNSLDTYSEPGGCRFMCPGAGDEDFEVGLNPAFDVKEGMGFAYFATRHRGRCRPRHELDALLGLAAVGFRRQDALAHAGHWLANCSRVPQDFTAILSDDYDALPESIHLYGRSIGVILVQWFRNYWFWRRLTM